MTSTVFNAARRAVLLFLSVSVSSLAIGVEDERWHSLQQSLFEGQSLIEDGSVLAIEAPKRAHDAAVVPIKVIALDPERQIQRVHLVVDKNPVPLAGIFTFTESSSDWSAFETRLRINEYTHVRAIGELADGSLHVASAFVKAAGGCSAPALSDMDAALARAGQMRLLIDDLTADADTEDVLASAVDQGGTEAVIKISHPNNSGMQFDQVSRNYIPAFFVHTISAELGGESVLHVETNFSLSENPVVRLQLRHQAVSKELRVSAIDSKGNRYEEVLSPL